MSDTPDNPLAAARQEAATRISEAWRREIHIDSADDLLARVRAVSRRTFMSNGMDDRRAVEAFADLDALLSSGGPLPAAWADCAPVRPVADVPGADELSFTGTATEAASLVCELAFRLAGKDAEINRLTAELDATRDVPVEYVITAGLQAAMASDPARADGTVLRCTDGAKRAFAWRAATREWEPAQ